MKVITANAASQMMPRNAFQDAVIKINGMIERAAKQDKTEVRVDFLADIQGDKVSVSPLGERVLAVFLKNGFSVRDIYDCGQFVDVGLALTWPDKVNQKEGQEDAS